MPNDASILRIAPVRVACVPQTTGRSLVDITPAERLPTEREAIFRHLGTEQMLLHEHHADRHLANVGDVLRENSRSRYNICLGRAIQHLRARPSRPELAVQYASCALRQVGDPKATTVTARSYEAGFVLGVAHIGVGLKASGLRLDVARTGGIWENFRYGVDTLERARDFAPATQRDTYSVEMLRGLYLLKDYSQAKKVRRQLIKAAGSPPVPFRENAILVTAAFDRWSRSFFGRDEHHPEAQAIFAPAEATLCLTIDGEDQHWGVPLVPKLDPRP